MARLIAFNKPFQVLSCFTDEAGRATLADYMDLPGVYAAGRLDYDSEGLLLLTDDGALQQRLAHPRFKLDKTYWVQVEGLITESALQQLRQGVMLKDGLTLPASAQRMEAPDIWPRHPPVRQRAHQPTCWIELKIHEGRNRQVRRMTAAVGFPTLRLIRWAIGPWSLTDLTPGQWQGLEVHLPQPSASNKRQPAQRRRTPSMKARTATKKPR